MKLDMPYLQKAECIAADLRRQITEGTYTQGSRLPTRATLCQTYGVTSDTLQRALNWLIEEGFVETAGRRGTFVSGKPPHLSNYAVLFPNRFLPDEPSSLFYRSLYREALASHSDRKIQVCDGFFGRAGFLEYESLLQDVSCSRLAGLIFASAPFPLAGTPLLEDDGLPRTAIMSQATFPHVPAVAFDHQGVIQQAASHLASAGCKRPAVLVNAKLPEHILSELQETFVRHDLPIARDHLMGLTTDRPMWAETMIRLLFKEPAAQRPDSLFVSDDNLVESATRALASLGLRAPEDVTIIAYANFPHRPVNHLPVTWVGISTSELLSACLQNIDQMRSGVAPPPLTIIRANQDPTPNQEPPHGNPRVAHT